jgi:hypothetical protein
MPSRGPSAGKLSLGNGQKSSQGLRLFGDDNAIRVEEVGLGFRDFEVGLRAAARSLAGLRVVDNDPPQGHGVPHGERITGEHRRHAVFSAGQPGRPDDVVPVAEIDHRHARDAGFPEETVLSFHGAKSQKKSRGRREPNGIERRRLAPPSYLEDLGLG